MVIFIPNDDF